MFGVDSPAHSKAVDGNPFGETTSSGHLKIPDVPLSHRASPYSPECPSNHTPGMQWRSVEMHPTKMKPFMGWRSSWALSILSVIIPILISTPLFALIPLEDPDTEHVVGKLIYILWTAPLAMVFFVFAQNAMFVGCLDDARPWRTWKSYVPTAIVTYCFVSGVMLLIYPFTDSFPVMGLIPFFVACVIFLSSMTVFRKIITKCVCSFYPHRKSVYTRIFLTQVVWMLALAGYTLAFRALKDSSTGQNILYGMVAFILLFVRKYWLCVTEPLPIEYAMLISGFWMTNMNDMFFTVAYPSVDEPDVTYPLIFMLQMIGSLMSLVQLTDAWFRFRVWIKQWLKSMFCCRRAFFDACCFCDCSGYERGIEEDLDPDDRGQSNQHPAYRRRHIQFFFFKVFSQFSAGVFFCTFGSIARFGSNSKYFPWGDDALVDTSEGDELVSDDEFTWAMVYSLISATQAVAVGIFGWLVIRKAWPAPYEQLFEKYSGLLGSRQFFGFIATILTSNSFLSMWWALAHNRIFFFRVSYNE